MYRFKGAYAYIYKIYGYDSIKKLKNGNNRIQALLCEGYFRPYETPTLVSTSHDTWMSKSM